MCHKFFFREAAGGPVPASDFDFFDFDDRQFLTVPDGLMIAFAAFHLERELLFAPLVFHDVGNHTSAGNRRPADGDFIAADHEDTVKSKWFARLDIKAFDFERVARDDTILFAASFQDCVHKFSRNGLDIKPDFHGLSTPEFEKNGRVGTARMASGAALMQKNHEKSSIRIMLGARRLDDRPGKRISSTKQPCRD
jgi:hypothetical protein